MEYWLAVEIYDINDDIEVEIIVIFEGELELAKGLLVHLAVIIVLYKMLNCFDFDFMAYSLKNLKQLVNK